jgi:hypothetical protein
MFNVTHSVGCMASSQHRTSGKTRHEDIASAGSVRTACSPFECDVALMSLQVAPCVVANIMGTCADGTATG